MNIYDLPNDVLNHIIYNFLPISDIQSILVSSKLFSVLSKYQYNIIKNASRGWIYCIQNRFIDSVKWIYELNNKLNTPIDIYYNNEQSFYVSCTSNRLEISKWLYQLSRDMGRPFNININNDSLFYCICIYNALETAKWIYQLSININSLINIHVGDNIIFSYSCINNNLEIAQWIY